MAKVRLQWKPSKALQGNLSQSDLDAIKYKSAVDVLKRVFKAEGLLGWYKGMHTQITKAVLCQAILFVSKEKVKKTERYVIERLFDSLSLTTMSLFSV